MTTSSFPEPSESSPESPVDRSSSEPVPPPLEPPAVQNHLVRSPGKVARVVAAVAFAGVSVVGISAAGSAMRDLGGSSGRGGGMGGPPGMNRGGGGPGFGAPGIGGANFDPSVWDPSDPSVSDPADPSASDTSGAGLGGLLPNAVDGTDPSETTMAAIDPAM